MIPYVTRGVFTRRYPTPLHPVRHFPGNQSDVVSPPQPPNGPQNTPSPRSIFFHSTRLAYGGVVRGILIGRTLPSPYSQTTPTGNIVGVICRESVTFFPPSTSNNPATSSRSSSSSFQGPCYTRSSSSCCSRPFTPPPPRPSPINKLSPPCTEIRLILSDLVVTQTHNWVQDGEEGGFVGMRGCLASSTR